ncbi:uncharacterized protein LOC107040983 [Diachasma alloeum]|uniref:uncharacterized protein LOC107040983 n=1 Tax=Diachasma alloeum TaxID=454923 RepID=UPI0007383C1C|nr:uncharacterized protein LOC107040983 [Diachasma alloeum]
MAERNRDAIRRDWEIVMKKIQISKFSEHLLTIESVKNKWKTLRTSYGRKLGEEKSTKKSGAAGPNQGKPWKFMKQMEFARDTFQPVQTPKSNFDDQNISPIDNAANPSSRRRMKTDDVLRGLCNMLDQPPPVLTLPQPMPPVLPLVKDDDEVSLFLGLIGASLRRIPEAARHGCILIVLTYTYNLEDNPAQF